MDETGEKDGAEISELGNEFEFDDNGDEDVSDTVAEGKDPLLGNDLVSRALGKVLADGDEEAGKDGGEKEGGEADSEGEPMMVWKCEGCTDCAPDNRQHSHYSLGKLNKVRYLNKIQKSGVIKWYEGCCALSLTVSVAWLAGRVLTP